MRDDFTRRPDSPAQTRGFEPILFREIGFDCEAESVREHPEWLPSTPISAS